MQRIPRGPLGLCLAVTFLVLVAPAHPPLTAQVPPGYYAGVDTTSPGTLRATLHDVIDDHTFIPYTSGATDTWDVLEAASEDPGDPGAILDVYKNASYTKQGGGNSFYDREHVWPKSYGFTNEGSGNLPHNDCHMLWLADSSYNGSRGNKPFRNCPSGCSERTTDVNDGMGGGSGVYPGNSNWTSGIGPTGSWEAWVGRRGDVARAILYADVRYEGGVHGTLQVTEPDLVVTNDNGLIQTSSQNESVAYMGILSVLLQWHAEDPVDDWERNRNDVVYTFQGNRNPFIDHPEWVDCLFAGQCTGGDVTPPAAPTGLVATGGAGQVGLDWDDNGEPDLLGYNVYRSATSGGPFVAVNGSPVLTSDYVDTAVVGGSTWYYVVTALDNVFNESGDSNEDVAMVGTFMGDLPWINELHYDNVSTDTGEFIEVAGPAGLDLTGWQIVLYNGNGGAQYDSANLSGVLADQGGCIGTLVVPFGQIQNGAPDGIALVSPSNNVVQFLSYEGSMVAVGGPADGLSSTDIGVTESNSTPIGLSLQLGGTGGAPEEFTWQSALVETPGAVNQNQTFDGCSSAGSWTDLGGGTVGAGGLVTLVGDGPLTAGSTASLELTNTPPSATVLAWLSFSSVPVSAFGGTIHATPFSNQIFFATNPAGSLFLATAWPAGVPPATQVWFQFLVADPSVIYGITLSNGVLATTP